MAEVAVYVVRRWIETFGTPGGDCAGRPVPAERFR
jgi:hypothetical protein